MVFKHTLCYARPSVEHLHLATSLQISRANSLHMEHGAHLKVCLDRQHTPDRWQLCLYNLQPTRVEGLWSRLPQCMVLCLQCYSHCNRTSADASLLLISIACSLCVMYPCQCMIGPVPNVKISMFMIKRAMFRTILMYAILSESSMLPTLS